MVFAFIWSASAIVRGVSGKFASFFFSPCRVGNWAILAAMIARWLSVRYRRCRLEMMSCDSWAVLSVDTRRADRLCYGKKKWAVPSSQFQFPNRLALPPPLGGLRKQRALNGFEDDDGAASLPRTAPTVSPRSGPSTVSPPADEWRSREPFRIRISASTRRSRDHWLP